MAKGKHTASNRIRGAHVAGNACDGVRTAAAKNACVGSRGIAAMRPTAGSASRSAAKIAIVICLALFLASALGIGLASAGGSALVAVNQEPVATTTTEAKVDLGEAGALREVAYRDVSAGVQEVAAEEEAKRIAAEEQARIHEAECIKRAQDAQAQSLANGGMGVYEVDWSVGRDAFLAEWTERINKYLSGSPLSGYGADFALAAWENGVDPRWSPAISNTESTKGQNCFAWHNAWGWTGGSWSSWPNAINAHVRGLAEIYGYTISFSNAMKYCPPNYANWYRDTLNEMSKI